MFGRIGVIALNTYRESVRARILLGLAVVAFFVSLFSLVVGAFTLKNAPRVVSDLGAASISIFSLLVAIVIGATSLYRELEQKTLFPILARPIRRSEYLVGKYLGTLLTIVVFIMADAGLVLLLSAGLGASNSAAHLSRIVGGALGWLLLMGLVAWRVPAMRTYGVIPWAAGMLVLGVVLSGVAPDERRVVLASSLLTLLEIAIVAAAATLFASFSTPFLSALFTLGVWLVGRYADNLARLPVKQFGQTIHDMGVGLSKIVPNLQIFVPARPLLVGEAIDVKLSSYLGMASLTSFGWSLGLLAVAALVFNERDFL
ncbi:ABC transporter permease subunit [Polyangium sp. y55x31]|uniref:ABC transporter permease n=1 Tax=Polyangium sp. y55x31 TaxID=3042688 RepID=UPI002482F340|nr:ABC transporter permease subunit [Polyangium sp. y55x31]MDI1484070.1 ABC transporter permease [Polyangium sp. y55x31]